MLMQRRKVSPSIPAPSNVATALDLLWSFLKTDNDELQSPGRRDDTGSPARHKALLQLVSLCKNMSTRQSLSTPVKK